MNAKQLAASLQNVGPVPAENLIAVGINTPGKLRKIGARRAHEKIFPENNLGCGKFNAGCLIKDEIHLKEVSSLADTFDYPELVNVMEFLIKNAVQS